MINMLYADKIIIIQGLYCASKEDRDISKTLFEELMGQSDFQLSTSKIYGIKESEEEQTNTILHHGNDENDENEGWKNVTYLKKWNNKQKNSEIGTRKTLAKVICKFYPKCKWGSSCWYLHSHKEKNDHQPSKPTNISMNACERTMESIGLTLNDSTNKIKKDVNPVPKRKHSQCKKEGKIESVLHIRKRGDDKRMSRSCNDCKNIGIKEKKNIYTLTCSRMKNKKKQGKIMSNQIRKKYSWKKTNFNCKYFKNRVCFNKLCKHPVTPVQTNAIDISKIILYQNQICEQLQYLKIIQYASNVSELIHTSNKQDCVKSICNRTQTKSKKTYKTEGADLETQLDSICGQGPKTNKGVKITDGTIKKAAYTDICSVDALLNLFRSTNFIESMNDHSSCNHQTKCHPCIFRSGLIKTEMGTGVKNAVLVPEVKNNLEMFLGNNYCEPCLQRFESKEDQIKHMEDNKHLKKDVSLKRSLDTLLSAIGFIDKLHLSVRCTECEEDMNKNKYGYLILPKITKSLTGCLSDCVSQMINNHQKYHAECQNGSYTIKEYPSCLLMMMHPESVTSVEERIVMSKEIYYLTSQVSFKNNHFYTRSKISDGKFCKFDGKESIPKETASNPKNTIIALYQKKRTDSEPLAKDLKKFIYSPQAVKYFRQSTNKYKEYKKNYDKDKYDHDPLHRQQKIDNEKKKYDEDALHRQQKLKAQKAYDKKKYDKNEEFRNKRKRDSIEYYKNQDQILRIIKKNFQLHDSGMDFLCVSCLRLHSRSNVSKYKKNRNEDRDQKLLLIEKSKNCDGSYYSCHTCRPGLIKGLPRLNFRKIKDLDSIGSIPNYLPDLNLMEKYLLKLTIPFIRVAHVPRTPNLKLVGGSICIQANISHSIERLKINPENIIPVSFKRKLTYKGFYMEQVINKEKVFKWLSFLKRNNPLYENIKLNETEVNDEIDIMSNQIISELVTYDEYRVLKDQLNEKKGSEANKITEDLIAQQDSSDSEEEHEDLAVDAVEALDEKEASSHDTFLYHVNELCLEEKTITNGIAKFIDEKDRKNYKLKDEFCPDPENFLFKDDGEEEDSDCLNEEAREKIKSTKDEFCPDADNFLLKDDMQEEAILAGEETKSMKRPETIIKGTNPENIFSKSFMNKSSRKGKHKEREKATVVAPGENQNFDNTYRLQEEKCFPTLFPKGT